MGHPGVCMCADLCRGCSGDGVPPEAGPGPPSHALFARPTRSCVPPPAPRPALCARAVGVTVCHHVCSEAASHGGVRPHLVPGPHDSEFTLRPRIGVNIGVHPGPGVTRGKQALLKRTKGQDSGPSASCRVWRADGLSSSQEDPCLLMGTDSRGGTLVGLLSAEVGRGESRGVWHHVRGLWGGQGSPALPWGRAPHLWKACPARLLDVGARGGGGPLAPLTLGKWRC